MPAHKRIPEGWDWRFDGPRIFYVDKHARGNEKRCFRYPPEEEDDSFCEIPGWEKVSNLFGRIFWRHQKSNLRSYQFPGICPQIKYTAGGELYVEQDGVQHWCKDDLRHLILDDADVACQITHAVWRHGLSDEALGVRGDLWRRSSQAKCSEHGPSQAVITEHTLSAGAEEALKPIGREKSMPDSNEMHQSDKCDATQSTEQRECAREVQGPDNAETVSKFPLRD